MYPTLSLSGDLVLQEHLSSLFRRPLQRGTLVTATSPLDPSHHICKRVIGLEGDIIALDPSRTSSSRKRGMEALTEGDSEVVGLREGGEWIEVPKGSVWLAGDNLSNSTDSRDYGPVPLAMIRGRLVAVVRFFEI